MLPWLHMLQSDKDKWQSYDDLLTTCRKKIEESEAEGLLKPKSTEGVLKHCESDNTLAMRHDAGALRPPNHWSSLAHPQLRATHSDPNR